MCGKVFPLLLVSLLVSAAEQTTERVFSLANAETKQDLQEVATVIRSVGGIRQVSADVEQKSVAIRGMADEVRLAEWMVLALDQPETVPAEYRAPGAADDVYRVFRLTHAQTPQDLWHMATLIRALADVQYAFIYTRPKALVIRGNAWRIGLAEWFVDELNRPANTPPPTAPSEYRLQGANDDQNFVRIFYTRARTKEELTAILTAMRAEVKILPRSFVIPARRAVVVRASADKMALAEQALQRLAAK